MKTLQMKKLSLRSFHGVAALPALVGAFFLVTGGMAHATTYYWDVNGTTAGSGANDGNTSHSWTTAANFTPDSTGAHIGTSAVPGSTDDVVFSAGAGVTNDANVAYTSVVTNTQSVQGITLNAEGTGALTLSGTGANLSIGTDGVTVTGSTATSGNVLTITAGSGTGSFTLNGAQTWSNSDTTGGVINVQSAVAINGLWTIGGGNYLIGSASKGANDSGSGGVRINGGNVVFQSPSAAVSNNLFGTGSVEFSGGSLALVTGASGAPTFTNAFSVDGNFTFAGGGAPGVSMTFAGAGIISNAPTVTISDTSSTAGTTFSNTVTLDSNVTFNGAGRSTFSGTVADDGNARSVTYSGTGTLNLTRSSGNTYTGGTTISSGTVSVANSTGSATGSGAVAVNGGNFTGTGIVAPAAGKNVTVASGAFLTPGTAGAGTLTFNLSGASVLALNTGSILSLTLNGASSTSIAFSSVGDWLNGSSGNATLSLNSAGSGINYADTYTVFSNVSTGGFAFANITGYDTTDYSAVLSQIGNSYDLSFQALSVPEPSTYMLFISGFGVMLLLGLRRRSETSL